jgi:UPF0716 protein FxsA
MLRLIAVLLLIPLLDMLLLLGVAIWVDWLLALVLVVLTGLIGMLLVRAEGRHTIRKIQRKLAQGEPPTDELIDGALLIAAGAFLLTPGLVTDAIGFLLVLPFTRYPIRVALKKWVVTPYVDAKTGGFATGKVYTGGFPGNVDVNVEGEVFTGQQRADGDQHAYDAGDAYGVDSDDDTVDVDDDSYDVDSENDNR